MYRFMQWDKLDRDRNGSVLMRILFSILVLLSCWPAYAQNAAEQTTPGNLTTSGCPSGSSVCFKPYSATNQLPIAVYDAGNHAGYIYTSNGSGSPATFQAGGASGVSSINTVGGAFTFTGSGVSCTSTTCTFNGGGSSGLTVGSTTVASGTTTRILFDNVGVLGEYSLTGSGNVVMSTSPTLVTPVLGVATATTLNKITLTQPATGSTITIVDGKTLTDSNTLTFTGSDGSSVNFGAGGTVLYGNQTVTLTGPVTGSGTTSIATTIGANQVSLGNIAQSAANTMLGNWTGSIANVSANVIPSCVADGAHALTYTNGTGILCTSVTGGGGTVTLGTSAASTNPQRSGQTDTGLYSATSAHVSVAVDVSGTGTQVGDFTATGLSVPVGSVSSPFFAASGTGADTLPMGTTAQRPSPSSGMIRLNTSTNIIEAYFNAAWNALAGNGNFAVNVAATPYSAVADNGTTDNTTTVTNALNTGLPVYFPESTSCYGVNNLTVPSGAGLLGDTGALYDTVGTKRSCITKTASATIILNPSSGTNIQISNLDIIGSTSGSFSVAVQCVAGGSTNLIMNNSSVRYCGNGGFGDTSNITHTFQSFGNYFYGNGASNNHGGIENLVDSHIFGGYIAANYYGIDYPSGANNNTVTDAKIEFGNGFGLNFQTNSSGNVVEGGTCDNNAFGCASFQAASNTTIANMFMYRNGRGTNGSTFNYGQQQQIYFNGGSSHIIITGVNTLTGVNDGGGGTLGPPYAVFFNNNTDTYTTITNNDLTGYTNTAMSYNLGRPTGNFILQNDQGAAYNYPSFVVGSGGFTATSNAALAAITGLVTPTLLAGKTYQFEIKAYTTATSGGGIQFDLNGGTATITSMEAENVSQSGTTLNSSSRTTTLSTVFCSASTVTAGTCSVTGSFVVNAAGTFAPRFAQNTSNAAVSTVLQGSYMLITQAGNN